MALSQLALLSQRQGDLFTMFAFEVNIAGADYTSTTSLPTGFGDVKLWGVSLILTGAGAPLAVVAQPALGPAVSILSLGGTRFDFVGTNPWIQNAVAAASNTYTCSIDFRVARLFRQVELLEVMMPDIETATTTGDLQVQVLVQRLRDVGAQA